MTQVDCVVEVEGLVSSEKEGGMKKTLFHFKTDYDTLSKSVDEIEKVLLPIKFNSYHSSKKST